jgi:hypothetical protein
MTRHSASGDASTVTRRSSTYSEPPAQAGSLGSGSLGAPATDADEARDVVLLADHLVHDRSSSRSGEPCRHGRDE